MQQNGNNIEKKRTKNINEMTRMKEWQVVTSTEEYRQRSIDSEYDRNRAEKSCLNEKP